MDADVQAIVQEIERYLRGHPRAADTARGVAYCWLASEGRTHSVESVHEALDEMVRLGVMEVHCPIGGEVAYRAVHGRSRRPPRDV